MSPLVIRTASISSSAEEPLQSHLAIHRLCSLSIAYMSMIRPPRSSTIRPPQEQASPSHGIDFAQSESQGSNRTYEIFIYGGLDRTVSDPKQQTALSDAVCVLSLPGFVWFKADFPAPSPRHMHSCNVVGKGGSQMIVIGGLDQTFPNVTITGGDRWSNGINIFDMSQLQWKDSYVPNDAKYQTPSVITEWYAKHGPYPSFQNATLQSLFTQNTTSSPSPVNPSPTPRQPHSNSHSYTGAIVGGVIGGVAALAIVAIAAFVILSSRRRLRNQRTQSQQTQPGRAQHEEYRKAELDNSALPNPSPKRKSRGPELDGSVVH